MAQTLFNMFSISISLRTQLDCAVRMLCNSQVKPNKKDILTIDLLKHLNSKMILILVGIQESYKQLLI